jgi:hypothetical protein
MLAAGPNVSFGYFSPCRAAPIDDRTALEN